MPPAQRVGIGRCWLLTTQGKAGMPYPSGSRR